MYTIWDQIVKFRMVDLDESARRSRHKKPQQVPLVPIQHPEDSVAKGKFPPMKADPAKGKKKKKMPAKPAPKAPAGGKKLPPFMNPGMSEF